MREIKFRARRAELPAGFVYGYFAIINGLNHIINEDGQHKVIAGTKGQYIEIPDKNKKDIFENDILLKEGLTTNGKPHMELVEWNHTHILSFEDEGYTIEGFLFNEDPMEMIIIGNKHDNPELLKEVQ